MLLTAGVAGSFGKTWSLDRLVAQTATGCAAGELTGSGCKQGATTAAILGGLAWGADYFRQDQIENSRQFKGICLGNTDQCSNNLSRGELGGGRWDVTKICRTGEFSCTVDDQGLVRIRGYGVENLSNTNPADALQAVFKVNGGNLLSPMGGLQGRLLGYLKMFGIGPGDYSKDGFWSKWMVEPFGGTHDYLNSSSAYDMVNEPTYKDFRLDFQGNEIPNQTIDDKVLAPRVVGNIRPDYGWLAKSMNVIDIPLAAPFATAAIIDQLPPGTLQTIYNARQSIDRGSEPIKKDQP